MINERKKWGIVVLFDATAPRRNRLKREAEAASATNAAVKKAATTDATETTESIKSLEKFDLSKNGDAVFVPERVATSKISAAELERYLIDFVVEQTGYPPEMVDLDADLEGDLGIDSVKKAQLLGELNETFRFADWNADDSAAPPAFGIDEFPTLRAMKRYLLASLEIGDKRDEGTTNENNAKTVENVRVAKVAAFGENSRNIRIGENAPNDEKLELVENKRFARNLESFDERAEKGNLGVESPVFERDLTISRRDLERFLIDFVVEQTGYPEEMVNLDADLEGDLGIDSVKKAQLLGELNETFRFADWNADGAASSISTAFGLGDFPTLRDFLEFVLQNANAVSSENAENANFEENAFEDDDLRRFLIDFVAAQTDYPRETIDLDANLETNLGIDSVKKAFLFGAIAEEFNAFPLANAPLSDFATLRQIYRAVEEEKSRRFA